MPDGSLVEIDHLSVDIAKETLGVFTCPSGDASAQFLSMLQKDQSPDGHVDKPSVSFAMSTDR